MKTTKLCIVIAMIVTVLSMLACNVSMVAPTAVPAQPTYTPYPTQVPPTPYPTQVPTLVIKTVTRERVEEVLSTNGFIAAANVTAYCAKDGCDGYIRISSAYNMSAMVYSNGGFSFGMILGNDDAGTIVGTVLRDLGLQDVALVISSQLTEMQNNGIGSYTDIVGQYIVSTTSSYTDDGRVMIVMVIGPVSVVGPQS